MDAFLLECIAAAKAPAPAAVVTETTISAEEELEKLMTKARRTNADREHQAAAVKPFIHEIKSKIADATPVDIAADEDTEMADDGDDAAAAATVAPLAASAAEIAMADSERELTSKAKELGRNLRRLDAAQRAAIREMQPCQVTTMATNSKDLADFFAEHGVAQRHVRATLPPAFASQLLGSGVQMRGSTRAKPASDAERRQERLQTEHDLMNAHLSVVQAALTSLDKTIQTLEASGQFVVPRAEDHTADALVAQMINPIGALPPCKQGEHCLGLKGLPPFEDGTRVILKAWQTPEAIAAFVNSGVVLTDSVVAATIGTCVPCTLMLNALRAHGAIMRGEPCSVIKFPFGVVAGRAGGFARSHLISHDTMNVNWPNLALHHFVPQKRVFDYTSVDIRTGVATKHSETVYGYTFRSDVLFDATVYCSGADEHAMIPARSPPLFSVAETSQPNVPNALLLDIKNSPKLRATLAQNATMTTALSRLCNELDVSLRAVMSADDDSALWMRRQFSTYWDHALHTIGAEARGKLGEYSDEQWNPHTHALLATVMWRTGMSYMLMDRHGLRGNVNMTAFIDAHTAVQRMLFKRWMELQHPPSDAELFAEEVAVINSDTVVACLHKRRAYPLFPQPYLSPNQQFEVRPRLTHLRRPAPIDAVRTLVLPESARRAQDLPRAQSRAAFEDCAARWNALSDEDRGLHELTFSSLPDSITPLGRWISKTIGAVALQEDFEESVWLLRAVVGRWPWFPRMTAALLRDPNATTADGGRRLFGQVPVDTKAREALSLGVWYTPLTAEVVDASPFEPTAELPAGVPPAVFESLTGRARYSSTYGYVAPPAATLNIDAEWAHRGQYFVLLTLALRVHELQRIAQRYEAGLSAAFDDAHTARSAEAADACSPIGHPNQPLVANAQRIFAGKPAVHVSKSRRDESPPYERLVNATYDLLDKWDAPETAVAKMLPWLTLVRDVTDEALEPIVRGEVPLFDGASPPCLGPPPSATNRIAYAARCALFEHLDMASVMLNLSDASDVWFYQANDLGIRNLQTVKPVPGTAVCEDTIADLSSYILDMDLLRQSDVVDHGDRTETRRSWVMQVVTALQRACYIRDFAYKHRANCENTEYMTWCAQSLLVTALGTYRHACASPPFASALRMYEHLRPEATQSSDGRRRMAEYLVAHTYTVLIALRENLMLHVATSLPNQRVLSTLWTNFAYVQQWWVPAKADQLRRRIATDTTPDFSATEERTAQGERAAEKEVISAESASDAGKSIGATSVPRVFRHMRETFFSAMLARFEALEIVSQTSTMMNACGEVSSLPPIVNMIAPEIKREIALRIGETDPLEPVRLEWFTRLGLSARGAALLVLANALYVSNARPALMNSCLRRMSRADFLLGWTILHMVVLHRDTMVLPMPYETARRQFLSAQYRAQDMLAPPPLSFTHMRFCHIAGCAAAQAYHVPFADPGHYGAQEDALAIDMGQIVCGHRKTTELFGRLSRRTRESKVPQIAANLNAVIVAAQNADNEERREVLEADLAVQIDKLKASESKNVRAVVNVMMALPCNALPMLWHRVQGAMVYRRNSLPAREGPRVYTLCTLCGTPSLHSMDRHGPNGFVCGYCDKLERSAVHGKWCFSCGAVEPAETLPVLTGETHAAARMARSEHQPQGSSIQPRSLKAQQTRLRNESNAKRQALTPAESADDASRNMPADTSDVLAENPVSARMPPRTSAAYRKNLTAKNDQPGACANDEHTDEVYSSSDGFNERVVQIISNPVVEHTPADDAAAPAPATPRNRRSGRGGGGGGSASAPQRKQNTADKDHLGVCLTDFHANQVHLRIDGFTERVVYDDVPDLGTHTTRRVYMCQPCENKLRNTALSATEILYHTRAPPTVIWVNGQRIALDRRVGRGGNGRPVSRK